MARIALLGTGLLGSGMVRRLLKTGSSVKVWNRTASKARALEAEGATLASSIQDAVTGVDRIHIVVQEDEVVDALLDQIAPSLGRGALVVDHSTTLPDTTRRRADRLRSLGTSFLHAPVFMSPEMAADGIGLMLVSGAQGDFDRVRADLEKMTGELWYLGDRPDLAAAYKLFGNCMLFAISAGLADVIAMARANAIDPVEALSVFSKFQTGGIIQRRGPRMARNELTPASFGIAMARKDVRLMMEAAKGAPLVALPGVAKRMDEVIAGGGGDHDLAALVAPPGSGLQTGGPGGQV